MHYPILLETELANRWRLSVKTLRTWRQRNVGPRWYLQVVGSVRYSPLAVWHWEQQQSVIGRRAPTPSVRERAPEPAPPSALKAPRWYEINQTSVEVTKSDTGDAHITRHCPALPSASGDFPHTFQHPI